MSHPGEYTGGREKPLVDSTVILDIVTGDAEWLDWSADMLEAAVEQGPVAINPVIYAEVSVRFATIEAVEAALPREYFRREALPGEASFLAARCFARYRTYSPKLEIVAP